MTTKRHTAPAEQAKRPGAAAGKSALVKGTSKRRGDAEAISACAASECGGANHLPRLYTLYGYNTSHARTRVRRLQTVLLCQSLQETCMKIKKLLPSAALSLALATPGLALAQQGNATTTQAAPAGQASTTTGAAPATAVSRYMKLDDMNVVGANGDRIGEVSEALIDSTGRVVAVAVEAGGFLGMGDRDVVVQLDQLRFEGNRFVTNLTAEQMKALPEWKD
jgi:sporulation protein YlmC with PRC-barrel domain